MEEKKDIYSKPPRYCPDCGKKVEINIDFTPMTFEEWLKCNRHNLGTSCNPQILAMAWKAGLEQFILSWYKELKNDPDDMPGYLCDEILSKGTKILKGEKLS